MKRYVRRPRSQQDDNLKIYANIWNPDTNKQTRIGGTRASIKKDLRDMEKLGLINEDCIVDVYAVNEQGSVVSLMEF